MRIFWLLVLIITVYYVFFRKNTLLRARKEAAKKDMEVGKTVIIKKEPNPAKINIDAEDT